MGHDARVNLRISADLRDGLEAARRAHGRRSVSDEARAAIQSWVEATAERLAEEKVRGARR